MTQWDGMLLQFLRKTFGAEPRMNRHRIATNLRDGGMGLRQEWWAFISRWVTLGQSETRPTGQTNRQFFATQYKYLHVVQALAGSAG